MSISIKWSGIPELSAALQKLDASKFDKAVVKNMGQIYNRGTSGGGTPVSTEATRPGGPHGELRGSFGRSGSGATIEVGYTKDYAPHVEYGHRTRGGGYVEGQRFLKKNVDTQKPMFLKDLKNALKGE